MITQLTEELAEITEREAARADKKWPRYASHHEAYAVLLEEVQEAWSELKGLRNTLNLYWGSIRNNRTEDFDDLLYTIRRQALLCAAESVQAAAVCERALKTMEDSAWKE